MTLPLRALVFCLPLLVPALACGTPAGRPPPSNPPNPRPAASAPSRTARATPRATCLDDGYSSVLSVEGDDRAVRTCFREVRRDPPDLMICYRIDATSGAISVDPPPSPSPSSRPAKKKPESAGRYRVVQSRTPKSPDVFTVIDTATKKTTGRIALEKDAPCGTAEMLDDVVYVTASVCEGPGDSGRLYDVKGHLLAELTGAVSEGDALRLENGRWLFVFPLEEEALQLIDLPSGKVTARLRLGDTAFGPDAGAVHIARGTNGDIFIVTDRGDVRVVNLSTMRLVHCWTLPKCSDETCEPVAWRNDVNGPASYPLRGRVMSISTQRKNATLRLARPICDAKGSPVVDVTLVGEEGSDPTPYLRGFEGKVVIVPTNDIYRLPDFRGVDATFSNDVLPAAD